MPIRNLLFVTIFIAILFVSGAWTLFSEDHNRSDVENRNLAQMPNAKLQNLLNGKYAKDFEDYLKDQFFAREFWLQYLFELQAAVKFSDIGGVVKGKDNYLLETRMYNNTNVSNINKNIEKIHQLAGIIGADRLYVAVAPRQTQANQDKLPFYVMNNADEYMDIFLSKISADITKIDLRNYMKNRQNDLYFRTDHHWNINGAYLAYREILNIIRKTYPQISRPFEKTDYTIQLGTEKFYGSLARRSRDIYGVPPDRIELWYPKNHENTIIEVEGKKHEGYFDLKILNRSKYINKYFTFLGASGKETVYTVPQNDNMPNVLIIGDSYALPFTSLISQHFYRTHLIYLRNVSNLDVSRMIENNDISIMLMIAHSDYVIRERITTNFR